MRPRILDDAGLAGLVTRLIVRERWSPEQIAGRIGVERPDLSVSVSTIYRAVNDVVPVPVEPDVTTKSVAEARVAPPTQVRR